MRLGFEVIVKNFSESVISGIQKNIKEKRPTGRGPMIASGRTLNSFGWRFDGRLLEIYSSAGHVFSLETGRGPTINPGSGSLKDRIRVWIDEKGIVPEGNISKDSLAFLIARKIHRDGTELYRRGGNSGILKEYISESFIRENLTKKLESAFIERATEAILNPVLTT